MFFFSNGLGAENIEMQKKHSARSSVEANGCLLLKRDASATAEVFVSTLTTKTFGRLDNHSVWWCCQTQQIILSCQFWGIVRHTSALILILPQIWPEFNQATPPPYLARTHDGPSWVVIRFIRSSTTATAKTTSTTTTTFPGAWVIHPSSVFKTCFKSVKPASPVSPVTPVHVAHPLASGLQNVELVSHGNCLGLTFTAKADLINSQWKVI